MRTNVTRQICFRERNVHCVKAVGGTSTYRRLRGDMIQVFKMVHKYYDVCAAVKLNFNTLSTTRAVSYTHLTLPTTPYV